MSSLWMMCTVLWMCFGFGKSDICNGGIYELDSSKFPFVRPRGLIVKIHSPRNETDTNSCEITNGHLNSLCHWFNHFNLSWPARLYILCDSPRYAVHVAQPTDTLLHCSGQIIDQLGIHNCSMGWWDISQLAIFTDPKVIVLVEVSFNTVRSYLSDTAAVANSSIHVRTVGITIVSTTDYPSHMFSKSTLQIYEAGYIHQLGSSCIPCQIKNHQNAVQYQESIRKFPTQRFTKLQVVKFSDINMTGVSDLRGFGEISGVIVVNCGLKSFPLWRVTKIRHLLNYSPYEKVVSGFLEKATSLQFMFAPDSPRQYKDHPLWNKVVSQLAREYYLIILDLSLNAIKDIPYFEGMERLDGIVLEYNDLHGSGISNLSFATNLIWLSLSFNPLEYLPDNLFAGCRHLETLWLKYCNLKSMESIYNHDLKSLTTLDVSGNPINYVPPELLLLTSLLELHISHNNVADLTFPKKAFTSRLSVITLYDTQLSTFPAELLTSSFSSMGDIILWANVLSSAGLLPMVQLVKDHVRSGQRGVVELLFNCIEYIPLEGEQEVETLDRVLDSFTIYLHHNPLHCGCEEMIAWLQSRGVKNTFAIKCSKKSFWLSSKRQKEFLSAFPTSRCDKYIKGPYPYQCSADIYQDKVVKLTTVTILGFTAVIVLIVVLKRQSFYLQQWLFILTGLRLYRRGWQRRPFKYDAFVCYCGDDYRWVFQTLLLGLEEDCNPPYSLCVHDRDFVVGKDIADNVMNAMEASRAVILVLSPNSAQSEWCGFEINAAIEERILGQKQLPIIPVILDHVNLQAFTRKQRRVLKRIPSLLAEDLNIVAKLRFILGNPLTIQEDNCSRRQGAGATGALAQAGDMGAGEQAGDMRAGEQDWDIGAFVQAGDMGAGAQAGAIGAGEQAGHMGAGEQAGHMAAGEQAWLMGAGEQESIV